MSRSAARSRGKAEERRACRYFGFERRGPETSRGIAGLPDSPDDCPLAIESKNVAREGVYGEWILQAKLAGIKLAKPWIVWKRLKGSRLITVTCDVGLFGACYDAFLEHHGRPPTVEDYRKESG